MKRAQALGLIFAFLLLLPSYALADADKAALQTLGGGHAAPAQQEDGQPDMPCAKCDEMDESAEDAEVNPDGFAYAYSAAFASGYVWRGLLLTDGPVFQPSFTISQEQLSLNLWGNMDLSNANGFGGELSEVDLTLDYTNETSKYAISAGVAYYGFPHTGAAGTSEAYAAIAGSGLLNPKATLWRDFGETKGTYLDCSISHSFPMGGGRMLDLSAGVGWGDAANNEACFGVQSSALCDLHISVEVPIETGRGFYITPALSYSRVLDGKLRKAASPDDIIAFCLTLSFEH